MKTVAKAINILKQFTEQTPSLGVIEISRATNIDKAIVHRILKLLLMKNLSFKTPKIKNTVWDPLFCDWQIIIYRSRNQSK